MPKIEEEIKTAFLTFLKLLKIILQRNPLHKNSSEIPVKSVSAARKNSRSHLPCPIEPIFEKSRFPKNNNIPPRIKNQPKTNPFINPFEVGFITNCILREMSTNIVKTVKTILLKLDVAKRPILNSMLSKSTLNIAANKNILATYNAIADKVTTKEKSIVCLLEIFLIVMIVHLLLITTY